MTVSNSIQTSILAALPRLRRPSPSGWFSFNAPCCSHRGHQPDRRGRGGLLPSDTGGISYNCFNCGYTASWQPGRHFNYRFRRLLAWLGVAENELRRLQLEALRLKDELGSGVVVDDRATEIKFEPRPLPTGSVSYQAIATFSRLDDSYQFDQDLKDQVEYIYRRGINMQDYDFYYSTSRDVKMNRRVIVPYTWHGEIVGYTARAIDQDTSPRYHSSHDASYVFNIDRQTRDRRFVLVHEGPFDAMSLDGVAVLSSRINETQAEIIEGLSREIIVVPDFDPSGRGVVEDALEYGWAVSFPVWAETCKDINEAVLRYGKLFVLRSILDSKETNQLRIRLLGRRYYGEIKTR